MPRLESIQTSVENNILKKMVYQRLKNHLQTEFFSQATQDLFVLEMLSGKKGGFYVEIGGGHPSESNNTMLLESQFDWSGISFELDASLADLFNSARKNKCLAIDATTANYSKIFSEITVPAQIDYVSIDIEPATNSFNALTRLPHDQYRFSVITFEHDRYISGSEITEKSREFLAGLGYQLVVADVCVFGKCFEDWWIDPKIIPEVIYTKFVSKNLEFSELWS